MLFGEAEAVQPHWRKRITAGRALILKAQECFQFEGGRSQLPAPAAVLRATTFLSKDRLYLPGL